MKCAYLNTKLVFMHDVLLCQRLSTTHVNQSYALYSVGVHDS